MKVLLLCILIGFSINACPSITYVSGGMSGSGFASRYWDCCKPSCSWTENAGKGNEARECDVNQKVLTDKTTTSICDSGTSYTCLSQYPFTLNGCDNIGFAFAAVPGDTKVCGRCFELTFTGEGKYETKLNHQKLKGKKLIVMASNIGYDVDGGQFDVMIPGGGVGIFNGCANLFDTSNLGAQYGGLLSDCETSVGYDGTDEDIYKKRKECLVKKCATVFAKKASAKMGCLFLANFMEAAGNPLHTFKEVNCPEELKKRY